MGLGESPKCTWNRAAYELKILTLVQKFQETLAKTTRTLVVANIAIRNAVSNTFEALLEADPEDLERNFRVTRPRLCIWLVTLHRQ